MWRHYSMIQGKTALKNLQELEWRKTRDSARTAFPYGCRKDSRRQEIRPDECPEGQVGADCFRFAGHEEPHGDALGAGRLVFGTHRAGWKMFLGNHREVESSGSGRHTGVAFREHDCEKMILCPADDVDTTDDHIFLISRY